MTPKKKRTAKEKEKAKQEGIKIEESGRVKAKSSVKWRVQSQSLATTWYIVILAVTGMHCTCEQNSKGNAACKHIQAVMQAIGKTWTFVSKKIRIIMPECCHYCRSTHIVKNGWRRCKKKKDVQRHLCKDCHRTFSGVPGFKFRHYNPLVITSALLQMATGNSAKKTAENLQHTFKVRIHPCTMHRRADDCSALIDRCMKTLRPRVGFM